MERLPRLILGGTAGLIAAAVGAVIAPELVYDRFIWQHFWGPIAADAANVASLSHNGVVAHPGYTLISEVGYGLILAYALLVVQAVLQRYDIGADRRFVLAFVPFTIAGGLLRVIEDMGGAAVLDGPVQYLLISPVIYGTMFLAGITALGAGIALQRRGRTDSYHTVVIRAGTAFALVCVAGIWQLHLINGTVFRPVVGTAIIGLAGVLTAASVAAIRYAQRVRVTPLLASTTGTSVLFGHMLDASSTAISLTYLGYGEKHPVVQTIITAAGNAFVFIPVKLGVIGAVLYLLGQEDENVFGTLVLLAVLAVGMGPGVRNTVRAVFGV